MRWDAATDKYVPVDWDEAFARDRPRAEGARSEGGGVLHLGPRLARSVLHVCAVRARMYGTNNLPDSSNMCHESTSVALPESIGVPVGTVHAGGFRRDRLHLLLRPERRHQQPAHAARPAGGAQARRADHHLQSAARARPGALHQSASPGRDADAARRRAISSQYHQVKAGGDIAALMGMCKALIEAGRRGQRRRRRRACSTTSSSPSTPTASRRSPRACAAATGPRSSAASGLTRSAHGGRGRRSMRAPKRVIGIYGMGLTQHQQRRRERADARQPAAAARQYRQARRRHLPGARPFQRAGPAHGRHHRKARAGAARQAQGAVRLRAAAREGPATRSRPARRSSTARCKAFVSLGGNFVRAVPDTAAMEPAWRKLRLTVQIATKLNRSHLIHGEVAYLLPCLGRIEIDQQASGAAGGVDGGLAPAASTARAACAKPASRQSAVRAGDRRRHRQGDAAAQPEGRLGRLGRRLRAGARRDRARPIRTIFNDFNERMWQPGGFHRPLAARAAQVEDQDRQGQLHRAARRCTTITDMPPTAATCCG